MATDILIVDDERDIRGQIAGILEDEGYATREAANSAEALGAVAARLPALVILDVWLSESELDGLQILETLKRDHPQLQVLMISGHGTVDMAVTATKMGAYDFIQKPFKTDVLLLAIERALNEAKLRRENAYLKSRTVSEVSEIVGQSGVIQEVRRTIDRVAPTESRVLVFGPAGAGKSVVARLLHDRSARREGPFVTLSCAGLDPATVEERLFGREPQGGGPRRVGVLEEAHGGTLFLDEVADMPLETQGKITRVLHSLKFRRLGGGSDVSVNVRVVAATNSDLRAAMADGRFREDLYYRLAVVPISLPPLVARREDIPALALAIMPRVARALGRPERRLGEDALAALQAHDWPGNVWELVNVLERILLLAGPGDSVGATAVTKALGQGEPGAAGWDKSADMMMKPLREAREAFEKAYLLFQLSRFGGNISRTAEFVGMDRAALHRKLKTLGVGAVQQGKGQQGKGQQGKGQQLSA